MKSQVQCVCRAVQLLLTHRQLILTLNDDLDSDVCVSVCFFFVLSLAKAPIQAIYRLFISNADDDDDDDDRIKNYSYYVYLLSKYRSMQQRVQIPG